MAEPGELDTRVEVYTLALDGRRYELVCAKSGALGVRARLLVDGEERAETVKELESLKLADGDLAIEVKVDFRRRPKKIKARFAGREVHFIPPEGSHLAKLERWERERPLRYASRHVLIATAQVLIPLLGLSALLRLLVPRVDWPDLPHLDLPSVPWPDLPDLRPDLDLPDLTPPQWLQPLLDAGKLLGPILLAVAIAVREIRKNRRKFAAREAAARASRNASDGPVEGPRAAAAEPRDEGARSGAEGTADADPERGPER
ncbi:hypothetical protein EDD29_1662 [Actinocorallia herbida]|uniref:Uncharacterized protein n=1 Tax=Actinocorallia herbida TaxID=58109 RepID=A0A3N1CSG2_9ACTN|nr:hypothetical protein EDD29_1662 [Actinocorallia herbida]